MLGGSAGDTLSLTAALNLALRSGSLLSLYGGDLTDIASGSVLSLYAPASVTISSGQGSSAQLALASPGGYTSIFGATSALLYSTTNAFVEAFDTTSLYGGRSLVGSGEYVGLGASSLLVAQSGSTASFAAASTWTGVATGGDMVLGAGGGTLSAGGSAGFTIAAGAGTGSLYGVTALDLVAGAGDVSALGSAIRLVANGGDVTGVALSGSASLYGASGVQLVGAGGSGGGGVYASAGSSEVSLYGGTALFALTPGTASVSGGGGAVVAAAAGTGLSLLSNAYTQISAGDDTVGGTLVATAGRVASLYAQSSLMAGTGAGGTAAWVGQGTASMYGGTSVVAWSDGSLDLISTGGPLRANSGASYTSLFGATSLIASSDNYLMTTAGIAASLSAASSFTLTGGDYLTTGSAVMTSMVGGGSFLAGVGGTGGLLSLFSSAPDSQTVVASQGTLSLYSGGPLAVTGGGSGYVSLGGASSTYATHSFYANAPQGVMWEAGAGPISAYAAKGYTVSAGGSGSLAFGPGLWASSSSTASFTTDTTLALGANTGAIIATAGTTHSTYAGNSLYAQVGTPGSTTWGGSLSLAAGGYNAAATLASENTLSLYSGGNSAWNVPGSSTPVTLALTVGGAGGQVSINGFSSITLTTSGSTVVTSEEVTSLYGAASVVARGKAFATLDSSAGSVLVAGYGGGEASLYGSANVDVSSPGTVRLGAPSVSVYASATAVTTTANTGSVSTFTGNFFVDTASTLSMYANYLFADSGAGPSQIAASTAFLGSSGNLLLRSERGFTSLAGGNSLVLATTSTSFGAILGASNYLSLYSSGNGDVVADGGDIRLSVPNGNLLGSAPGVGQGLVSFWGGGSLAAIGVNAAYLASEDVTSIRGLNSLQLYTGGARNDATGGDASITATNANTVVGMGISEAAGTTWTASSGTLTSLQGNSVLYGNAPWITLAATQFVSLAPTMSLAAASELVLAGANTLLSLTSNANALLGSGLGGGSTALTYTSLVGGNSLLGSAANLVSLHSGDTVGAGGVSNWLATAGDLASLYGGNSLTLATALLTGSASDTVSFHAEINFVQRAGQLHNVYSGSIYGIAGGDVSTYAFQTATLGAAGSVFLQAEEKLSLWGATGVSISSRENVLLSSPNGWMSLNGGNSLMGDFGVASMYASSNGAANNGLLMAGADTFTSLFGGNSLAITAGNAVAIPAPTGILTATAYQFLSLSGGNSLAAFAGSGLYANAGSGPLSLHTSSSLFANAGAALLANSGDMVSAYGGKSLALRSGGNVYLGAGDDLSLYALNSLTGATGGNLAWVGGGSGGVSLVGTGGNALVQAGGAAGAVASLVAATGSVATYSGGDTSFTAAGGGTVWMTAGSPSGSPPTTPTSNIIAAAGAMASWYGGSSVMATAGRWMSFEGAPEIALGASSWAYIRANAISLGGAASGGGGGNPPSLYATTTLTSFYALESIMARGELGITLATNGMLSAYGGNSLTLVSPNILTTSETLTSIASNAALQLRSNLDAVVASGNNFVGVGGTGASLYGAVSLWAGSGGASSLQGTSLLDLSSTAGTLTASAPNGNLFATGGTMASISGGSSVVITTGGSGQLVSIASTSSLYAIGTTYTSLYGDGLGLGAAGDPSGKGAGAGNVLMTGACMLSLFGGNSIALGGGNVLVGDAPTGTAAVSLWAGQSLLGNSGGTLRMSSTAGLSLFAGSNLYANGQAIEEYSATYHLNSAAKAVSLRGGSALDGSAPTLSLAAGTGGMVLKGGSGGLAADSNSFLSFYATNSFVAKNEGGTMTLDYGGVLSTFGNGDMATSATYTSVLSNSGWSSQVSNGPATLVAGSDSPAPLSLFGSAGVYGASGGILSLYAAGGGALSLSGGGLSLAADTGITASTPGSYVATTTSGFLSLASADNAAVTAAFNGLFTAGGTALSLGATGGNLQAWGSVGVSFAAQGGNLHARSSDALSLYAPASILAYAGASPNAAGGFMSLAGETLGLFGAGNVEVGTGAGGNVVVGSGNVLSFHSGNSLLGAVTGVASLAYATDMFTWSGGITSTYSANSVFAQFAAPAISSYAALVSVIGATDGAASFAGGYGLAAGSGGVSMYGGASLAAYGDTGDVTLVGNRNIALSTTSAGGGALSFASSSGFSATATSFYFADPQGDMSFFSGNAFQAYTSMDATLASYNSLTLRAGASYLSMYAGCSLVANAVGHYLMNSGDGLSMYGTRSLYAIANGPVIAQGCAWMTGESSGIHSTYAGTSLFSTVAAGHRYASTPAGIISTTSGGSHFQVVTGTGGGYYGGANGGPASLWGSSGLFGAAPFGPVSMGSGTDVRLVAGGAASLVGGATVTLATGSGGIAAVQSDTTSLYAASYATLLSPLAVAVASGGVVSLKAPTLSLEGTTATLLSAPSLSLLGDSLLYGGSNQVLSLFGNSFYATASADLSLTSSNALNAWAAGNMGYYASTLAASITGSVEVAAVGGGMSLYAGGSASSLVVSSGGSGGLIAHTGATGALSLGSGLSLAASAPLVTLESTGFWGTSVQAATSLLANAAYAVVTAAQGGASIYGATLAALGGSGGGGAGALVGAIGGPLSLFGDSGVSFSASAGPLEASAGTTMSFAAKSSLFLRAEESLSLWGKLGANLASSGDLSLYAGSNLMGGGAALTSLYSPTLVASGGWTSVNGDNSLSLGSSGNGGSGVVAVFAGGPPAPVNGPTISLYSTGTLVGSTPGGFTSLFGGTSMLLGGGELVSLYSPNSLFAGTSGTYAGVRAGSVGTGGASLLLGTEGPGGVVSTSSSDVAAVASANALVVGGTYASIRGGSVGGAEGGVFLTSPASFYAATTGVGGVVEVHGGSPAAPGSVSIASQSGTALYSEAGPVSMVSNAPGFGLGLGALVGGISAFAATGTSLYSTTYTLITAGGGIQAITPGDVSAYASGNMWGSGGGTGVWMAGGQVSLGSTASPAFLGAGGGDLSLFSPGFNVLVGAGQGVSVSGSSFNLRTVDAAVLSQGGAQGVTSIYSGGSFYAGAAGSEWVGSAKGNLALGTTPGGVGMVSLWGAGGTIVDGGAGYTTSLTGATGVQVAARGTTLSLLGTTGLDASVGGSGPLTGYSPTVTSWSAGGSLLLGAGTGGATGTGITSLGTASFLSSLDTLDLSVATKGGLTSPGTGILSLASALGSVVLGAPGGVISASAGCTAWWGGNSVFLNGAGVLSGYAGDGTATWGFAAGTPSSGGTSLVSTGTSLLAASRDTLSLFSGTTMDISAASSVSIHGGGRVDIASPGAITSLTAMGLQLEGSSSLLGSSASGYLSLSAASSLMGWGEGGWLAGSNGLLSLRTASSLVASGEASLSLVSGSGPAVLGGGTTTSLAGASSLILSGGSNYIDLVVAGGGGGAGGHINTASPTASFYASGEMDVLGGSNAVLSAADTASLYGGSNILVNAGDVSRGNVWIQGNSGVSIYSTSSGNGLAFGTDGSAITAAQAALSLYGGSGISQVSMGSLYGSAQGLFSMYTGAGALGAFADSGNPILLTGSDHVSVYGANSMTLRAGGPGPWIGDAGTGTLSLTSSNAITATVAGNIIANAVGTGTYLSLYGSSSFLAAAGDGVTTGITQLTSGFLTSLYSGASLAMGGTAVVTAKSAGAVELHGSDFVLTETASGTGAGDVSVVAKGNVVESGLSVGITATAGNVVLGSTGGAASLTSTGGVYLSSTSTTTDAYLLSSANVLEASQLMTSFYAATSMAFNAPTMTLTATGTSGGILSLMGVGSLAAVSSGDVLLSGQNNWVGVGYAALSLRSDGAAQLTGQSTVSIQSSTGLTLKSQSQGVTISAAATLAASGFDVQVSAGGTANIIAATSASLYSTDMYAFSSQALTLSSPSLFANGAQVMATGTADVSITAPNVWDSASNAYTLSVTGTTAQAELFSNRYLGITAGNSLMGGASDVVTLGARAGFTSLSATTSLLAVAGGVASLQGGSSVVIQGGSSGSPGPLLLAALGSSTTTASLYSDGDVVAAATSSLFLRGQGLVSMASTAGDVALATASGSNVWVNSGGGVSLNGAANFGARAGTGGVGPLVYGEGAGGMLSMYSSSDMELVVGGVSGGMNLVANTMLSTGTLNSIQASSFYANGAYVAIGGNSLFMAAGGGVGGTAIAAGKGPLSISSGAANEIYFGADSDGGYKGAYLSLAAGNVGTLYGDGGLVLGQGLQGTAGTISISAPAGSIYANGLAAFLGGTATQALGLLALDPGYAIASLASTADIVVRAGTGNLVLSAGTSLLANVGDKIRVNGAGGVSLGSSGGDIVMNAATGVLSLAAGAAGSIYMGGSPTLDISASGSSNAALTATSSGTASFAAPTLYLSGTTSLLAGGVSYSALTSGHTLEMKAGALASLYGPSSFYIAASDTGTSSLSLFACTALQMNTPGTFSLTPGTAAITNVGQSGTSGVLSMASGKDTYAWSDNLYRIDMGSSSGGGVFINSQAATSVLAATALAVGSSGGAGVAITATTGPVSLNGVASLVARSDEVLIANAPAIVINSGSATGSSSGAISITQGNGVGITGLPGQPAINNPGLYANLMGDFVTVSSNFLSTVAYDLSFAAGSAGVSGTGNVDMHAKGGYLSITAQGGDAFLGAPTTKGLSLFGGGVSLVATGTGLGAPADLQFSTGVGNLYQEAGGSKGISMYAAGGGFGLDVAQNMVMSGGNQLSLVGANSIMMSGNAWYTSLAGNMVVDQSQGVSGTMLSLHVGPDASARLHAISKGELNLNAGSNAYLTGQEWASVYGRSGAMLLSQSLFMGTLGSGVPAASSGVGTDPSDSALFLRGSSLSLVGIGGASSLVAQHSMQSFYSNNLGSTTSGGFQVKANLAPVGITGESVTLTTNVASTTSGGLMTLGARSFFLSAPNLVSIYTGSTTSSNLWLQAGYGVLSTTYTQSIVAGMALDASASQEVYLAALTPKSVACPTCGILSAYGASSAYLSAGVPGGTVGTAYVTGAGYASVSGTLGAYLGADVGSGFASIAAAAVGVQGVNSVTLASNGGFTSVHGYNSIVLNSNNYEVMTVRDSGGVAQTALSLSLSGFGVAGSGSGTVSAAAGLTLAGFNLLSLYSGAAAAAEGGVAVTAPSGFFTVSTGNYIAMSTPSSITLSATSTANPLSLYAGGNLYGYSAGNLLLDSGTGASSLTSATQVVLQTPTTEAPNAPASRITATQGVVSITSSARVDLGVLDASSFTPTARLLVGGSDASALVAYANSIASIYGGASIVGVAGGATGTGMVSFGAASHFVGSTSLAVVSTSDVLGVMSMASSTLYMGGGGVCTGSGASAGNGGSGYGCASGGGQVRVPNSGVVFSSRLYISCASTASPAPTATQILNAAIIIVSQNCPSGTVILLPNLEGLNNVEGWRGTVVYDKKAGGSPYLTSPTSDYILLQFMAAERDVSGNFLFAKVASRTAVDVVVYMSDWDGTTGTTTGLGSSSGASAAYPTYAVIGATDSSLSTNPWQYK